MATFTALNQVHTLLGVLHVGGASHAQRENLAITAPSRNATLLSEKVAIDLNKQLKGSEKQAAWALKIKAEAYLNIIANNRLASAQSAQDLEFGCFYTQKNQQLAKLLKSSDARYIIDNRGDLRGLEVTEAQARVEASNAMAIPAAKLPVCKSSLMRYAHQLRRGGMAMSEALKAAWAAYKAA